MSVCVTTYLYQCQCCQTAIVNENRIDKMEIGNPVNFDHCVIAASDHSVSSASHYTNGLSVCSNGMLWDPIVTNQMQGSIHVT